MCPSVAVGGKAGLIGTFSCVYFYCVSVCINDLMQIKAVLAGALYHSRCISGMPVHRYRCSKHIAVVSSSLPILLEVYLLSLTDDFRDGWDHSGLCGSNAVAQIILNRAAVDVHIPKTRSSYRPRDGIK